MNRLSVLALFFALGGCGFANSIASSSKDVEMFEGPEIRRIVTKYDNALSCIGDFVPGSLFFAVGDINDATGKESYAESGSGKMVTQGAGEMIQTALFTSGVRVLNRRDPSIAATEHNWGIRPIESQVPVDLYITGSINSLDFIPGAGAQVEIMGVGPRARQNRLLVGMDLSMTDTATGEVIANVAVQKQLVGEEIGFAVGRFFDTGVFNNALVNINAGAMVRETMNFVLRQMLYYGTYQLIVQAIDGTDAKACNENLVQTIAEDLIWKDEAGRATFREIVAQVESRRPPSEAEIGEMRKEMSATAQEVELPPEVRKLANSITSQAARAISTADSIATASDVDTAQAALEKARLYLAFAVRDLRKAAEQGLSGAQGDAVATVVEQAIRAVNAGEVFVKSLRAKTEISEAATPQADDGKPNVPGGDPNDPPRP